LVMAVSVSVRGAFFSVSCGVAVVVAISSPE
jgi:hypothetical protein